MSSTNSRALPAAPKALNVALWVAQILLFALFAFAGFHKATMPAAELNAGLGLPTGLGRFIGVVELAGALGVVLPAATRIRPLLTPLAAAGFVVVMILAALFHLQRGEWASLPVNVVVGALAAFVAWGRTKKAPIEAR